MTDQIRTLLPIRVARLLPEAQTLWLPGDAGHFVYLNECRREIRANGVPLCKDRTEGIRAAVHDQLKSDILRLLNSTLRPK